jgi:hypothetical protein
MKSFTITTSTCEIFLQVQRLAMAEVEAQPVRRIERAALRHVIAKRAAQRLVQQMRRGMVGANGPRRA